MAETVKVDAQSTEAHCAWELLHPHPDPLSVVRLLNQWMHDDRQEQRETLEFLCQALDERRPEGSKLFP